MNSVMMNYQPLRPDMASRRTLAFKSRENDSSTNEPEKGKDTGWKGSMTSFGQGLVSSFEILYKNGWKGFAEGAMAVIGTGAVANAAFKTDLGRRLKAPLMVFFGVFGIAKGGMGAYDAIKNRSNYEKRNKGCYELGQGITSTALALIGSKGALAAASPTTAAEIKGMNYAQTFWGCIKQSGSLIKNNVNKLEEPISKITLELKDSLMVTMAGLGDFAKSDTSLLDVATGVTTKRALPSNSETIARLEEKATNNVKEALTTTVNTGNNIQFRLEDKSGLKQITSSTHNSPKDESADHIRFEHDENDIDDGEFEPVEAAGSEKYDE